MRVSMDYHSRIAEEDILQLDLLVNAHAFFKVRLVGKLTRVAR